MTLLCLRYSFDMNKDADDLEAACANALSVGYRTLDIMESGKIHVSTEQMGQAVCDELNKL